MNAEDTGSISDLGTKISHVCVHAKSLSHVRIFVTLWTVAHQTPLSMGFSRQEYWSGLPWPPPGDLSNRGIKSGSSELQADSLPSEPLGTRLTQKLDRYNNFLKVIHPRSLTSPALAGRFFTTRATWEAQLSPPATSTELPGHNQRVRAP